MNTKNILIFTVVSCIIVVSIYIGYQVNLLKSYTYNIIGYTINRLGLNNSQIDVDLEIANNSDINLTVRGYNIDAFLNGKPLGNFQSTGLNVVIPAKQKGVAKVAVTFNPLQTIGSVISLGNINAFFNDKSKLVFGFKGKISVDTIGLTLNNIKIDTTLSLAEMQKENGKQKQPKVV